ncbi:group II intron reverse transcriptase/maturase [Tomitella fengzijianii]|uniref:group II intron reverse transcriptase/maturase n=1 Tax=Tomitella fengzijianii TaxID=2597660 RepID=UPI00131ACA85|nr:group II intron reverse transcriptase/maturase [Tomitella fengzijianii]
MLTTLHQTRDGSAYDITTRHHDTWRKNGRRTLNGTIALSVPVDWVQAKCRQYQYQAYRPLVRNELLPTSDHHIVTVYGAEYRGYVQYYQMAGNINWLNKIRWTMERSMFTTLAKKHRRPPWVMRERLKSVVETPHGKRRCFEAVLHTPSGAEFTARFGGILLRKVRHARLLDGPWPARRKRLLIARLKAGICELCQSRDGITVYHIARLADLDRYSPTKAPEWVSAMRQRRSKTLIVCAGCHTQIHPPGREQHPPESRVR